MAHLERSVATLRIMGDDLDPEEITQILGCEPTWKQTKGQVIIGKNTGSKRTAKSGMWRLKSTDREPENLNAQIEEILSGLPSSTDIWNELSKRFEIDIFCGLFMGSSNEGVILSPKSMFSLGVRGIELDLDIYDADEDEVSE